MNILKNPFSFNKKNKNNKDFNYKVVDQYKDIAEIVKEARIKQKLTIQELSYISKIPSHTISSIEENDKDIRPKSPFIKSILIKLEDCLELKKNKLVNLLVPDKEVNKKENNDFLLNKFDLINTWQGTLLYFFLLVLTIFFLKIYFISNVNVIEIQNIENNIIDK